MCACGHLYSEILFLQIFILGAHANTPTPGTPIGVKFGMKEFTVDFYPLVQRVASARRKTSKSSQISNLNTAVCAAHLASNKTV